MELRLINTLRVLPSAPSPSVTTYSARSARGRSPVNWISQRTSSATQSALLAASARTFSDPTTKSRIIQAKSSLTKTDDFESGKNSDIG